MSTNQKGAIAETAIAHAAVKLGIEVYRPVSEGGRYDMILAIGDRLERVQCKWAALDRGVVVVRAYSSRRTRSGMLKRGYTADEIDAIAAYCAPLDRCLYFPIDWLRGRTVLQLRSTPTQNNQRVGVNWLDDFAFERLRFRLEGP